VSQQSSELSTSVAAAAAKLAADAGVESDVVLDESGVVLEESDVAVDELSSDAGAAVLVSGN
jgi:hypothetical protein